MGSLKISQGTICPVGACDDWHHLLGISTPCLGPAGVSTCFEKEGISTGCVFTEAVWAKIRVLPQSTNHPCPLPTWAGSTGRTGHAQIWLACTWVRLSESHKGHKERSTELNFTVWAKRFPELTRTANARCSKDKWVEQSDHNDTTLAYSRGRQMLTSSQSCAIEQGEIQVCPICWKRASLWTGKLVWWGQQK